LSMDELGRLTPEAFESEKKTPLALVLDNVRSALNAGSAFRTADAFALQKIYLCGITATPPHREILKTALGATETISWEYCKHTVEAVEKLRQEGWAVLAVEQAEGAIEIQNFEPQPGGKYALIFGNEVDGVSEEVMNIVDGCLEIPQFGTKHSLNIAVSIGIVVWDLFKKIRLSVD
jgi:23S rRNA (guanosine2251-2'-O)-methyltransferase